MIVLNPLFSKLDGKMPLGQEERAALAGLIQSKARRLPARQCPSSEHSAQLAA
ncbi:hypothetical protein [Sphingomonas koreensis]|uniref:hypothetical protein n=1 Tax=Sphingomonas koreensis TaxID=93064 RepID=UPI0013E0C10C|nr:hypothetical protein [Sphingomonas koreensis]